MYDDNLTNCLVSFVFLAISLLMYGLMRLLSGFGDKEKCEKVLKNYLTFLYFSSPTLFILFCISAYRIPYDLGFFHF